MRKGYPETELKSDQRFLNYKTQVDGRTERKHESFRSQVLVNVSVFVLFLTNNKKTEALVFV